MSETLHNYELSVLVWKIVFAFWCVTVVGSVSSKVRKTLSSTREGEQE